MSELLSLSHKKIKLLINKYLVRVCYYQVYEKSKRKKKPLVTKLIHKSCGAFYPLSFLPYFHSMCFLIFKKIYFGKIVSLFIKIMIVIKEAIMIMTTRVIMTIIIIVVAVIVMIAILIISVIITLVIVVILIVAIVTKLVIMIIIKGVNSSDVAIYVAFHIFHSAKKIVFDLLFVVIKTLCCFQVIWLAKQNIGCYPEGTYLLKVNNRNFWTRFEICSKLTIKTPELVT